MTDDIDAIQAAARLAANKPFEQPPCARAGCGHDADLHALDGRGITGEPYCEHEDGCACPSYLAQEQGGSDV